MKFKFETGNDLILKSLCESRRYLEQAALSLSRVGDLIDEYELWRLMAGDVHEMQGEASLLTLRVVGCMELIERELPSEAGNEAAQSIEPDAAPY